MRRASFLFFALLCAIPTISRAQFFPREPSVPRVWLVLSDGAGPNGGGIANSSGLVQLFRASGTLRLTEGTGVELSALRSQPIYVASRLFNDPMLNSPRADGLTLAYASLARDGNRTLFPSSTVIGGALLRRPTNDPARTRLTGGVTAGIDAGLWRPSVDWFDATAGGRVIVMPSSNHRQLWMLALTLGLRFG